MKSESMQAVRRTTTLWLKIAVTIAISVSCIWLFNKYVWYPYQYPFGWSHSCDKILQNTLFNYAAMNDGQFPQGEATAEASLSLLSRPPWNLNAELLRGKTIPKDLVESILKRGELLAPETCGWHYVEGLREDDDQRIALFWDKVGLGHNGQRLTKGSRVVNRIGGGHETIPGSEWDAFLKEQRLLLVKLPEDRRRLAMKNFPQ